MGYFDAHSDLWSDVTLKRLGGETDVFNKYHLERFRRGNVEGGIFVIWIDPPYTDDYAKRTRQIMAAIGEEIAQCGSIRVVHNYDEMMKAKEDGKIYVLIGLEGMAAIGHNLDKIDLYYEFGARHGMLTWNEANELGAGAVSGVESGLTPYGKNAVRIMQEKGMIVDTSHLNEAGFWDIIDITTKPVIASHSNSRRMCDSKRNLTDDQLRAIRDCGGVVGLNSFKEFVSADNDKKTVMHLAEHAAHMADVMGIDHVGCGFDFFEFLENDDTVGSFMAKAESPSVDGMCDCSEIPNLFQCLEKLGMTKEERDKIACGNFRRIIKEIC